MTRPSKPTTRAESVFPGLLVAAAASAVVLLLTEFVAAAVPALPAAVLLGLVLGNATRLPDTLAPGLSYAARTLLRAGIVFMGLRIAVVDIAELGLSAALLIVGTVVIAFTGIVAAARKLGLPHAVGLLTGAGFAICGASAIAAAQALVSGEEDEVAISLGNVLVFGTLSMLTFPLIAGAAGLDATIAGMWMGASIHDVGQAVAAGGALGEATLQSTVVVKLGRVALLGPLLVMLGLGLRRRGPGNRGVDGARPPLVPVFVIGFFIAMLVANTVPLPQVATTVSGLVEQVLLVMALFALGTSVRFEKARSLGPKPLMLGAAAWIVIGAATFVAAQVVAA